MYSKIKKFFIRNYKVIVCFICTILFIDIAIDVFNKEIIEIDTSIYSFISTYLIRDNITPIMKVITWFGSAFPLIIVTLLCIILFKNKKDGILVLVNLVFITIFNQAFKHIFQRARPSEFMIVTENGYSFPSGHSMVSMAFYGFLIYLIYKRISNKYLKWGLICFLLLLILLIGISRIYLGVHYTSDVIGGFLLSISYLLLFVIFIDKMKMLD